MCVLYALKHLRGGCLQITGTADPQAAPSSSIQGVGAPVCAGWARFDVWGSFNGFV